MNPSKRNLACFLSLALIASLATGVLGQSTTARTTSPPAAAMSSPAAPRINAPTQRTNAPYGPTAPSATSARSNARPTTSQGAIRSAQAPFGQLTPKQRERLNLLLSYWEQRSSKVKIFTCRLTRWEYDPVFGPKNPLEHKTISRGIVRYAAPDKGEFHVQEMGQWTAPREPGGKPSWPMKAVKNREHWICDGNSIFEFKPETKKLVESVLPPEMRGKAIVDGPLPFLFGAEKNKLLARYWIHEIPSPDGTPDQIWMEAYPKFSRDAVNYRKITVILDKKMFLPIGLQVFATNGKSRTAYQFTDRKVNHLMGNLQNFTNSFIRPTPPLGWQKVVENYGGPVPAQAQAPQATSATRGTQAQRPRATPPPR